MTEPTTAAGRDMLEHWTRHDNPMSHEIAAMILAIEAEARQQDASALREVRATLAGLSLPLGTTREAAQHERDTALAIIDAALAALPPSAPAGLDVPLSVLDSIIAAMEKAHIVVNRHGTPEEYRDVSEALAALYDWRTYRLEHR